MLTLALLGELHRQRAMVSQKDLVTCVGVLM